MPETIVAAPTKDEKRNETLTLRWLALALTPGLGPGKARRLVEFFGGVQALFAASLTELEAAGIRAVSAQSLGTGHSMELAHDEVARAVAAEAHIVAFEDPAYPAELKQIYDPPWLSSCGGMWPPWRNRGSRWWVRPIPHLMGLAWPSD